MSTSRSAKETAGAVETRSGKRGSWSSGVIDVRASGARIHERVIALIESQIVVRNLRPGDRLPPERELAELLGVGRPAIREALRILEYLGVITSQVGRGPRSGSVLSVRGAPALTSFLRLHMAMSRFDRDDLLQTRIQLEILASMQAARRATPADLKSLDALVSAMGDRDLDAPAFFAIDTQFHVALATASGNGLIGSLMDAIRDVVENEMNTSGEGRAWTRLAARLRTEHAAILAAVQNGDGPRAAKLVAEHIRKFYGMPPS